MWFKLFQLGILPKKKESICPYKDLYMNIHSSFICKKSKAGNNLNASQWVKAWATKYLKEEYYLAIKINY